ncbi:protein phosphatase [Streptomyces sp. Ru73]|uniref:PP2C family protein-serine/threonine phosphatase n=1 Tax=Streptomyces sp. Ru73 TaxID=2080748 RepID=UPI000CDDFC5B|nr:PP2C family protein-serine/threonine phosphatase [Streptomyces sp. Ru73]POX43003.1 protein phosphatase [Streptomyces sp. Ru73]
MIRTRAWRPLPHVPGESRGGFARRLFVLVLPGLWVAGILLWEWTGRGHGVPLQLLAAAPAIACAGTGRRECVVLGGLCALLALVPLGPAGQAPASVTRLGTCAATLAVVAASYLTAGRRARLLRELALTRDVAEAAQRLVLRPLPARIGGIRVAAGHLSACEGALIGGDLYDAVPTRYGLRVVIGDVRGHGLAAIGTVSAMLGCFREAAHDEPGLPGVLRRLDRTLARHLADRDRAGHPAGEAGTGAAQPAADEPTAEEFVTVLLLQVTQAGEVTALNCGHPWPYRFSSRTAEPVADAEPLPPLGLFPLPDRLAALPGRRLERGEGLLLYTDGAEDARDAHGAFFPLHAELLACLAAHATSTVPAPCALVTAVRERIARHAGGRLTDDVALLALADDRPPVPA